MEKYMVQLICNLSVYFKNTIKTHFDLDSRIKFLLMYMFNSYKLWIIKIHKSADKFEMLKKQ